VGVGVPGSGWIALESGVGVRGSAGRLEYREREIGVPGRGGLEYLGEGGYSTWERVFLFLILSKLLLLLELSQVPH